MHYTSAATVHRQSASCRHAWGNRLYRTNMLHACAGMMLELQVDLLELGDDVDQLCESESLSSKALVI